MSESKRITVEEVRAAYEATGLRPESGFFIEPDLMASYDDEELPLNQCAGCAASALFAVEHKATELNYLLADDEIASWFSREYGSEYANGFQYGFDASYGGDMRRESERFQQGYADGCACAAALLT